MAYARKLTKEELIKAGISIDNDLNVYRNGEPVKLSKSKAVGTCKKYHIYNAKRRPYLFFGIDETDINGQRIKYQLKGKPAGYWAYKVRTITLQRAVYAWFYGEVPAGMVVDHIDNKHESLYDYRPENLQLLSQKENVHKNSIQANERQLKCGMHKPLEHFENRLKQFKEKLANCTDSLERHKLVNECARYEAHVRYWKAHSNEYYEWIEKQIKVPKIDNKQVKCSMHRPLEYYETKRQMLEAKLNNLTKHDNRQQIKTTYLRYCRYVRYWNAHKEEYYSWVNTKNI